MSIEAAIEAPVTPAAQEQVAPAAPEIHVESNFETEKPATQQTDTQATPNDDDQGEQKKDGISKRFGELTNKARAAEERARIVEDQNRQLLDLLSRGKQPDSNTPTAKPTEAAPKIEDFEKYEQYLSAQARWEAKLEYQAQRQAEQELTQKEQAEARHRDTIAQQKQTLEQQKSTLDKLTAEGEKKYADFYEVAFEQSPDKVPVSPVVGEAILKSKDGVEILYFLGKNPAEAQRIAKLDPIEQLVEIGTIRASLKQTKSAAPEPIKPVGQKSKASDGPSMEDDMDTWVQKRNAQIAARKGRR